MPPARAGSLPFARRPAPRIHWTARFAIAQNEPMVRIRTGIILGMLLLASAPMAGAATASLSTRGSLLGQQAAGIT